VLGMVNKSVLNVEGPVQLTRLTVQLLVHPKELKPTGAAPADFDKYYLVLLTVLKLVHHAEEATCR